MVGARKLAIARDYIFDHLPDQPRVISARVGRLMGWFRPFQTADFDVLFERRIHSQVRGGLWAHWAVSAGAVAGAVVLRRRGETLLPTLSLVGVSLWTAASTFGITRYRIGADVALLVLAAVGAGRLMDRWRSPAAPAPVTEPEPAATEPHDR